MSELSPSPVVVSEMAYQWHLELVEGYRKMLTRAESFQAHDAHETPEALRGNAQAFGYARQAILLHEIYFAGFSDPPRVTRSSRTFVSAASLRFGSLERMLDELRAVALAFRGWAIVGWDRDARRLELIGLDTHDQGALLSYEPLVVLDVYEHAYWYDWGPDKKGYVDSWLRRINYAEADHRYGRVIYG